MLGLEATVVGRALGGVRLGQQRGGVEGADRERTRRIARGGGARRGHLRGRRHVHAAVDRQVRGRRRAVPPDRQVVGPGRGEEARGHVGVRIGQRAEPGRLDRQAALLVEHRRRQAGIAVEHHAVVAARIARGPGPGDVAGRPIGGRQIEAERVAVTRHVEVAVAVGVAPRALPVPGAVVARRVDPEDAGRSRLVDLLREPAGAVEAAEQERVGVHDDVRLDRVHDVVDGLAELVGRVVVDEPVVRRGRHVVDDLAHELAVARAVGVEVAAGEAVGHVERLPVLALDRRELGAGQRVQPAGRSERLVEHDDRDAAAVVPRALQAVGAAQRDALRDDGVGRGRLGDLGGRHGGRAAHRRELRALQRGLEPAAHPALGNAAGRDDRSLRFGAVARRCHKHGSRDRGLGRASHRCGR